MEVRGVGGYGDGGGVVLGEGGGGCIRWSHGIVNEPAYFTISTKQAGAGGAGVVVVVCWLLNVPATCECISRTDLLRQVYVLPH